MIKERMRIDGMIKCAEDLIEKPLPPSQEFNFSLELLVMFPFTYTDLKDNQAHPKAHLPIA